MRNIRLLVTADPGVGKSTLLRCFCGAIAAEGMKVGGVLVNDRRVGGERVAFDAVDLQTRGSAPVAWKSASPLQANQRQFGEYVVDLDAIGTFVVDALRRSASCDVVVIAEIGRMEWLSSRFQSELACIFTGDMTVVASLSKYAAPAFDAFRNDPDNLVVEFERTHSAGILKVLSAAARARELFGRLSDPQRAAVRSLARGYLAQRAYISVEKLFARALPQTLESRLIRTGSDTWQIQRDRAQRTIRWGAGGYSCSCPLWAGLHPFEGQAQECSHIQTLRLAQMVGGVP
jgi:nucleoside-triphosphatase